MSGRVAMALLAFMPILGVAAAVPANATTTRVATSTLNWTKGTTIVNPGGGVNAVSCPTSTFCVAVDRTGAVSSFNGTKWSPPQTVDKSNDLVAISCPTVSFCMATDTVGDYIAMNNGTWGVATPFATPNSLEMQSVSCSSATFCLAVGQTSSFAPVDYYYLNGSWTFDAVAFAPGDNNPFDAVSCTSTNVCLATDVSGGVTTFTPSASSPVTMVRTGPVAVDPSDHSYGATSIACVSSTSCVVGSNTNLVSSLSGTTWTTSAPLPAGAAGVLVSCAQAICIADDTNALAVSAVAPFSTWSNPGVLDMLSQITGMSCYPVAVSIGCQAVDNDGFSIAISVGVSGVPVFTPATTYFDPPHNVTTLSCASATYCIAGDSAGETMTLRAGTWTKPHVITTQPLGVREIRCGVSPHPYQSLACAAVVGDFNALSLNSYKSPWSPVPSSSSLTYSVSCSSACEYLSPTGRSRGLVGGYLPKLSTSAIATDVSCPPEQSQCIAIDSMGHSYVSHKNTWSAGPSVTMTKGAILWALSCASMTFCVAIDLQGHAFTFDGTKWSAGTKVSPLGLLNVSCGATYFCVASDLLGGARVYNGTTWVATSNVSGLSALRGVSCASATTCAAVDASRAYSLTIPTTATKISFVKAAPGQNVVGHTVVAVNVSSQSAPSGSVTLSAGSSPHSPSCTGTLRKVDAQTATGQCTMVTTHTGATLIDANFSGAFGFAPSGPAHHIDNIVAAK
jgi:hypothetical protein